MYIAALLTFEDIMPCQNWNHSLTVIWPENR